MNDVRAEGVSKMGKLSVTNRMLIGLSFIEAVAKQDDAMIDSIFESQKISLDLIIGLTDAAILMNDAAATSEIRGLEVPETAARVRSVIYDLIATDQIEDDIITDGNDIQL